MSSGLDDSPTGARDPYGPLDLERAEGITTISKELPGGARHGAGGKFVLDDTERDADDVRQKFDTGDYREIRDGSLYQHARGCWYDHADADRLVEHEGTKYAVLTRSYEHPATDEDDEYAVTLASSRINYGKGEGDDYSPFYSYDLTVQPLDDDGEIAFERTPPRSLSLSIEPQYQDLVYPDGNPLRPPHGDGTLVRIQTTWVGHTEEFVERCGHLLGHALSYGLRTGEIVDESKAFSKAEVHHRVTEDREGDVVHTIRQTAELLAEHDSDVATHGVHEESRWSVTKVRTAGWEQLGFPRLDAPILIKFYYPDDPERVDSPLDQPKIEVALDGKETVVDDETHETKEKMIPWERWDEIMAILDEILLSHLEWADVSPADILADDYSDGAQNPRTRWRHPQGRRAWLRKHYESLVPALYREATRTRTDLVLDILDVVRRRGRVSYEDLIDETGADYRTIREHVRRLDVDVGGDDAPGLLSRENGAKTFVAFSSRFLEDLGENAIDSIQADREELAGERDERADERVVEYLTKRGLSESDAEALLDAIDGDRYYGRSDLRRVDEDELQELVDDLDVDVAGVALDEPADDSDDEDESEDDETVDETDGDDADDGPTWESFADVSIDADTLAYALDGGSVDAEHVRIRTDPYPTLTD